jgi:hypothetical protein
MEQIDDTLEEITPPCILELLSLPLDQAHRTKREEGLHGVRNILWSVGRGGMLAIGGGFSREGFMNEAFIRMTSMEQVCGDLLMFIYNNKLMLLIVNLFFPTLMLTFGRTCPEHCLFVKYPN